MRHCVVLLLAMVLLVPACNQPSSSPPDWVQALRADVIVLLADVQAQKPLPQIRADVQQIMEHLKSIEPTAKEVRDCAEALLADFKAEPPAPVEKKVQDAIALLTALNKLRDGG